MDRTGEGEGFNHGLESIRHPLDKDSTASIFARAANCGSGFTSPLIVSEAGVFRKIRTHSVCNDRIWKLTSRCEQSSSCHGVDASARKGF
jgi:hypothetical protein